jgi:hypothetical protein
MVLSVRVILAAAASLAADGVLAQPIPESVQPPAGQRAAMTWTGTGELSYECRAKADASGVHEWVFVGPEAKLTDAGTGGAMGRYFAGPTWEASDGSRITGKQVAVAPGYAGSIPFQLVKAEGGSGSLMSVTYIQRVNTRGGVAPTENCSGANRGARVMVPYSADYVFYKAG